MNRKLRLVIVLGLAVCVLTPMAFSFPLGKIVLNESPYEKFGALYYPFTFNIAAPIQFVLCESGVDPAGGCVNQIVSDVVCVNNNGAGEGVIAMISDAENSISLGNLPPDFPCPVGNSQLVFVAETGRMQTLAGAIPTTLPGGAAGPKVKIVALSDLEGSGATSDVLSVSGK
jgi:hypothetical protein